MSPPKEYSKIPVSDRKEMEIQELPDKEFKIILLWILRELQENTDEKFNAIRKTIQEQNEKLKKR